MDTEREPAPLSESQIAELEDWGLGDDEPTPPTPAAPTPAEPAAPEAPPVPAPSGSAPPAVAPPPDGSVSVPAPQSATPTPPAEPAPPAPDVPHVFRADGRDLPIPGAVKTADGWIKIPPEAAASLHHYLADRKVIQQRETQIRRDLAATQQQRSAKEAQADVVMQRWSQVAQMTPDQRWEWAQAFDAERPILEERARAQFAEEKLRQLEAQAQPVLQAQQWELEAPQYGDAVQQYVAQAAQTPDFQGLDVAQATRAVEPWLRELIVTAPQDMPDRGITRGQPVIDLDKLGRILQQEHRGQMAAKEAASKTQKDYEIKLAQAQAAQKNLAAQSAPHPQPVLAGAGKAPTHASPPSRDEAGRFTRKDLAWEDEFDSLDLTAE